MLEHINVRVIWADKRTVTVCFLVQPMVEEGILATRNLPLNPLDFASKDALSRFLADATRTQDPGVTVGRTCLDGDVQDLLRLLNVTGKVPDPVDWPLPNDA